MNVPKHRLRANNFIYLLILHFIYQAVAYYSNLFRIVVESNICHHAPAIYEVDGITHLMFEFGKVESEKCGYDEKEIVQLLNEYLEVAVLPYQKLLRPYKCNPESCHVCEALFVNYVIQTDFHYSIDIIYVDNSLAHEYVKSAKNLLI